MDKNNIEFVLTSGERGYPAGHFFSAALSIMLENLTLPQVFSELETLVAHSDSTHKYQLRESFPDTVSTIEKVFSGEMTRDQAFQSLHDQLQTLPGLIALALPELSEAVKEYARSRSETK